MPILLALLMAAAALAAETKQDFLPVAVWYGGGKARAPMLESDPRGKKEVWRKDLKQIKSLGFNTIRAWMDWASGEPKPRQYNFATLDVLLELAEEEGLKLVLQVYMDAAPEWVGRAYPDSQFVSSGGAVLKSESAPGFCVDHPGVRQAVVAFYTALGQRAARSPAFFGWDLWSEPHIINWATPTYLSNPEFCFCPYSVSRYRKWLQKKYGSLDALNKAWYRRFATWEEVEPNRLSTILSYTDYIDWRMFIRDKLGEDLKDRFDAVKRGAPGRVATSHAASPNLFTSPLAGDGSPDDWIMNHQVDYYGTSFYPKHSFAVGRDVPWRGALLDFTASAAGGRGFWVGELQAGFGTVALNVSGTVTPEDLRVWAWSALARGAKAINYYAWYPMNSGYESGGFGMIQLDGTITERSRAAGEVSRIVDRNQKLLLDARPVKAQVAIVYNPLSYMVGGRQRASYGGPQGEVATMERDSMLGMHRAMFPTNVPVDFIHINELQGIGQYKLVLLPYPLMLPEKSATALKEYVRNGGALVAEARPAWNNERGYAAETIPGLGLHEAFGCRETAIQSTPDRRTSLVWSGSALAGMKDGDVLPARLFEETLEPLGPQAQVVARFKDGAPAAVLSTFGRGRTLALGSYVGAAYQAQPTPAVARLFDSLLNWAGVERPVSASPPEIEVRLLESGGDLLAFVFNHAGRAIDASVGVAGAATRAIDLTDGSVTPVTAGKFGRRMEKGDVWVVRLAR